MNSVIINNVLLIFTLFMSPILYPVLWRIYIVKFWMCPPGAQILSISCNFWENMAKSYVGVPPRELAPPPRPNHGCATAVSGCFQVHQRHYCLSLRRWQIIVTVHALNPYTFDRDMLLYRDSLITNISQDRFLCWSSYSMEQLLK